MTSIYLTVLLFLCSDHHKISKKASHFSVGVARLDAFYCQINSAKVLKQ